MPTGKPLIAAVDDEKDILELISIHVQKAGFAVQTFSRADELLRFLQERVPDLVILDLMLPDMDGLEVCKQLRVESRTAAIPILILTAKGEEVDKVLGLELGADDYMVKPFSPKELVARIRAILRRNRPAGDRAAQVIQIGGTLEINLNQHAVMAAGVRIELTATEFTILVTLARRPGWVFSRGQLLDLVWGEDKAALDRTIDVHIKNLRDKLGAAGSLVCSVRGVGYKLEP